ncbi:unnamed protein product [Ilex paraguariensis]|uniref:Myb-like domain-containing protein n=1 Tax=Ilex paraguariensis TaxID=185542 RepID=A0ABC8TL62_9AQUA
MEDQYGMEDLRQYMNGRPLFPAIQPPADLLSGHRSLTQAQHYEMVMVGRQVSDIVVPRGLHEFRSDSTAIGSTSTTSATGATSTASLSGLEMEIGGLGGDGGTGRWPRQETLTLLEIRSRLDSKFKEANQKGPLWDEVSRIMSEEHGYQRSGKKCREKFENLYKYYKKTKEGKAGRQDGKHYRFFRQLEALYGETSNQTSVSETHLVGGSFRYNASSNNTKQPNQQAYLQPPKISESLSLSNSSGFDTSSSEDSDLNGSAMMDNDSTEKRKKRRGKRSWKAKIREFIDAQMRKLIEKQEAWLEKMVKTIEHKEQERMMREEEWRKQEAARIDREHKFWANERAWIEARDASFMEALQKLSGKELKGSSPEELMLAELRSLGENQNENGSAAITSTLKGDSWPESEITRLIQLRNSMEQRFQQSGCSEEVMWEEIAAKMACLGHDRSPSMCKNKWDSVNNYLVKCSKKRKDNSRSCCYFQNNDSIYNQGGTYCETNEQDLETARLAHNDHGASPPNASVRNPMHDTGFRFLMGDTENLWENYGLKLSKEENH